MSEMMPNTPIFQREWQVLEVLQSFGTSTVSHSDLQQRIRGRNSFKTAESLDEPLEVLEGYGYIRNRKVSAGKGRPSIMIDILVPRARLEEEDVDEDESQPLGPGVVRIRPPEWSRRTGMSRSETYRLMYSGELRAVKIGKMWFIDANELTGFFEREAQP